MYDIVRTSMQQACESSWISIVCERRVILRDLNVCFFKFLTVLLAAQNTSQLARLRNKSNLPLSWVIAKSPTGYVYFEQILVLFYRTLMSFTKLIKSVSFQGVNSSENVERFISAVTLWSKTRIEISLLSTPLPSNNQRIFKMIFAKPHPSMQETFYLDWTWKLTKVSL